MPCAGPGVEQRAQRKAICPRPKQRAARSGCVGAARAGQDRGAAIEAGVIGRGAAGGGVCGREAALAGRAGSERVTGTTASFSGATRVTAGAAPPVVPGALRPCSARWATPTFTLSMAYIIA